MQYSNKDNFQKEINYCNVVKSKIVDDIKDK